MIVEAVGTAVHMQDKELEKKLLDAMNEAIHQAIADGVSLSDSEEILRRKKEAYDRVMREK